MRETFNYRLLFIIVLALLLGQNIYQWREKGYSNPEVKTAEFINKLRTTNSFAVTGIAPDGKLNIASFSDGKFTVISECGSGEHTEIPGSCEKFIAGKELTHVNSIVINVFRPAPGSEGRNTLLITATGSNPKHTAVQEHCDSPNGCFP